jgi:hypothetical protein
VFRSSLRRQLLSPPRMRPLPIGLPQFVRLCRTDGEPADPTTWQARRGPGIAGSAHTARDLTRLQPGYRPACLAVGRLSPPQLFIRLCLPSEYVSKIAVGGITS